VGVMVVQNIDETPTYNLWYHKDILFQQKQDIMTQFVGHKTTEINAKTGPQSLYVSCSIHFACLHHTLLKFRLDIWSPWNLRIRSTEI